MNDDQNLEQELQEEISACDSFTDEQRDRSNIFVLIIMLCGVLTIIGVIILLEIFNGK